MSRHESTHRAGFAASVAGAGLVVVVVLVVVSSSRSTTRGAETDDDGWQAIGRLGLAF